jgi:NADPH:quinone reductase
MQSYPTESKRVPFARKCSRNVLAYFHELPKCQKGIAMKMRVLRVAALSHDFSGCALEDVPVPVPGPDEVLVRIRAAAMGFPDLLMTRGAYQRKPELPFVPGTDMAGEVVACGPGVTNVGIGDAVIATYQTGAFGEYALYPAAALARKPERLGFAAAAALGSAYLTAYVALVRLGRLDKGEWLLVHGAAGGVGLAAVDLGRTLGARVIAASASDDKLARIADLYAPEAIVNVRHGFRETVKAMTDGGAHVIYDPVGGDIFDESTRCIAFGGRLLVIGFASGRIPSVSANIPLIKGFSVVGVRAGEFGRRFPNLGEENHCAIRQLAQEGRIRPHVHAVLPLEAWREGFALMERRQVIGRVVLMPHD